MPIDGGKSKTDVVCFGMVTPAMVLVVEEMPSWNTGAIWSQGQTFISDDAAIIAILLRKWDIQTGLICTTLGDDDAGRDTVKQLEDLGIQGEFRLSSDTTTPFELNVSDRKRGGRFHRGGQVPRIRDQMDTATWLADRAFGKAVAQVETKSLSVDMGLNQISTEELLELLHKTAG
jgi:hypothetical protein